ncbi:pentapeptide repeat-containing protein [Micromonospora sp. NPDC049679]|uniref:pentapeptide repeat-containing protein n=1 Tax=Micromonospora sp. NPDC049679 TaxID=3155920 RepID=UPI0033EA9F32
MKTRRIGDQEILTPNLDPGGLDPVGHTPESDLAEAYVADQSWAKAHFSGVSLSRSHVERVDLTETHWRDVALYGCRLDRVNLSGAKLTGVMMERCHLVDCRLTALQLADTTLKNVILEDCRLDHATLLHVRTTGPAAVTGCDLSHSLLVQSRFFGLVARSCRLTGVEVDDCDTTGADLRDNDLRQVGRGLTSLRGAVIEESQIAHLATLAVRELQLTVRSRSDCAVIRDTAKGQLG